MSHDYDRRHVVAVSTLGSQLVAAFKMGVKHGGGSLSEAKQAAELLSQLAAEATHAPFQQNMQGNAQVNTLDALATALHDMAFAIGAAAVKPKPVPKKK